MDVIFTKTFHTVLQWTLCLSFISKSTKEWPEPRHLTHLKHSVEALVFSVTRTSLEE